MLVQIGKMLAGSGLEWVRDEASDLAAAPSPVSPDFSIKAIDPRVCLPCQEILPSMQCFTLGCPFGLRGVDSQRATPLVLSGVIAGVDSAKMQIITSARRSPETRAVLLLRSGHPLIRWAIKWSSDDRRCSLPESCSRVLSCRRRYPATIPLRSISAWLPQLIWFWHSWTLRRQGPLPPESLDQREILVSSPDCCRRVSPAYAGGRRLSLSIQALTDSNDQPFGGRPVRYDGSMRFRGPLLMLALAVLLPAGWLGWRWYTTPVPPALPLERMDSAVAELMRAALDEVHTAPRSGAAWGKLAMVAAANGYRDEALACLAEAERFDPHDPRWPYLHGHLLLADEPHKALPLLELAREQAGSRAQQMAIRFRLALVLIEDGQLDAAEEHLQALRELEPDKSVRVNVGLGLIAAARDQRFAAREHLQAVLNSPFACKQAHGQLAALALADGDAALARFHQQRYAQQPADIPWPDPFLDELNGYAVGRQSRFLEAESLEARGRLPEAVALLRRIAAEHPDARSYLGLGRALGNLGAYREAEPVLRTVVGMEPDNVQAHHLLGTVLFLEGEQEAAATDGKERAQRLFRDAMDEQDRVLAMQRDHAMAHMMRGRALAALGRIDAALVSLRQAVLCRPEFADTHLYLGETLASAGQYTAALPHLEDAARLARPDDQRPRQALEKWRAKAKGP